MVPTAYKILCVRLPCNIVRQLPDSSTRSTLDTGGGLDLSRQGLSPCKIRQALPSAITPSTAAG